MYKMDLQLELKAMCIIINGLIIYNNLFTIIYYYWLFFKVFFI
jgi:hypothetical protein